MKKLLKAKIILTILITFNLATFGQQFGIKASVGISRITSSMELINKTPSTPFVPSAQAGLYYHHSLGKKASLGAELLFSQIAGKENYKWDFKDLGNYYGEGTLHYTISRHISYFCLPVYYGLTFNKLTLHGGFQLSYALSCYDQTKAFFMQNGVRENLENHQTTNFYVRDYDFGPRIGIVYQLSDRLSMEGAYYYGLTDISYPKSSEMELKIQQMTLGLRYALKHNKEENTTVSGQQQLGIKAGGGLSRITNSWDWERLSTQSVPSGQVGFYYNRTLGDGSIVGMELLFSQIEGKEKTEGLNIFDEDFGIIPAKNSYFRHISYLSLPLYYGMNIKKLTINAGVQLSYAIAGSSLVIRSIGTWNEQPIAQEIKNDHLDVDKLDFGPRIGIIYPLTDRLALEATYYYGFNNIAKDGSPAYKLNVQQVSLGIRYSLWGLY